MTLVTTYDDLPVYTVFKKCFFRCHFSIIIWKLLEIFVPLHCQRKKTKFVA